MCVCKRREGRTFATGKGASCEVKLDDTCFVSRSVTTVTLTDAVQTVSRSYHHLLRSCWKVQAGHGVDLLRKSTAFHHQRQAPPILGWGVGWRFSLTVTEYRLQRAPFRLLPEVWSISKPFVPSTLLCSATRPVVTALLCCQAAWITGSLDHQTHSPSPPPTFRPHPVTTDRPSQHSPEGERNVYGIIASTRRLCLHEHARTDEADPLLDRLGRPSV